MSAPISSQQFAEAAGIVAVVAMMLGAIATIAVNEIRRRAERTDDGGG